MDVIIARLCEAFVINCELFFVTLLFAIPLGLVICFGSRSKFRPLAWLVKTFVWVIRGTPLMLQVIIFFFLPGLLRINYGIAIPSLGRFSGAASGGLLGHGVMIGRAASTVATRAVAVACTRIRIVLHVGRTGCAQLVLQSRQDGQHEECTRCKNED